MLLEIGVHAPRIDRAEYFIGSDPGTGKAMNIPLSSPAETVNVNFELTTGTLSTGFHNLYVRARYENGLWGLSERRLFYLAPSPVDLGDIDAEQQSF
ncbi:hypothetical protein [Dyadobacter luticola]|uniref:Uncharacterized protein n=1 Tax=Dyadobacter luticola TaxID=1979387 RepID=A0A5R9L5C4_9BACT|nr:hypothetical protein [Dyadobacter luticola]TLV03773.1 hypothetical protein FEN17_09320 [Dyadobacter luticola]